MKRFDPISRNNNGPGWFFDSSAIMECVDGDYVRVADVKSALFQVRQAQARLEDDYPNRTNIGKDYDVSVACQNIREAHKILALLCEP